MNRSPFLKSLVNTLTQAYFLILPICLLMAMGFSSELVAQRVRFDYSRYETENLAPYRSVVEFVYPEISLGGINPISDSLLPEVSLVDVDQFFSDSVKIYIDSEPNVIGLVERHKYLNNKLRTTQGFRIQIVSTSNRKLAKSVQARFESMYPGYIGHLNFEPPNYKVRAGDFLKRTEADLFRDKIIYDFPGAFRVNAMVRIPKYKSAQR